MRKGDVVKGIVTNVCYGGKGIVEAFEESDNIKTEVKNVIPGQKVTVRLKKKKNGIWEGTLLSVDEKAPNEIEAPCPHFEYCGGCTYQNLSYDDQIALKDRQIKELLGEAVIRGLKNNPSLSEENPESYFEKIYEGMYKSPVSTEYRNKMEFSFGDECKGGELSLGLHKRGSFYDIVHVKECKIVDSDYRQILSETLSYFRGKECTYFHKITHEGFLRHLLVRKAVRT